MSRGLSCSLCVALVCFAYALAADRLEAALAGYTVTDLGTMGGSSSFGEALNDAGQAVGTSFMSGATPDHAFFYSNGIMHDLGTLPGTSTSGASAVNNQGQVVGQSYNWYTNLNYRAFLWQNGGPMVDLGTLGGAQSGANSINDQAQIVGWSETATSERHGFLYHNGQMTDLGKYYPLDINNLGQIVGSKEIVYGLIEHAFIYENGTATDLGTAGTDNCSNAQAINTNGQICGVSYTQFQNGMRAWIYQNAGFTDLGSLGGTEIVASDINDAGQVVGHAYLPGDAERHAFLYQNGALSDLNTLIPEGSGWELERARGINDAGQIVGEGLIGTYRHAFLLTPTGVPEPASAGIMICALAAIALPRR